MSQLSDENWSFQCVAHRGYRAHYAENTLRAFEKALEVGATMLELDVRLTKDDVVVVLHDPTMLRLGNDRRHVSSICWEELKDLDLHDAKARHFKSGSVLSLEKLLSTFGKQTNYYIEIKKRTKGHPSEHQKHLCDLTIELVRKYDLEDHTMYVAFDPWVLTYYRSCCPNARLGLNFRHPPPSAHLLSDLKKLGAVLCPHRKLMSHQAVQAWKRKGFRVIPWVVNNPEDMKLFKEMGVDGITTDNPELLVKLRQQES